MEKITQILNGLDFTKLVPNIDSIMGKVRVIGVLALLIGPILMLILGALYLFKPTKEANRRFGFRTYFGMGSVEAWRFTQKIAGLVYGGLGAVLTIVMGIICLTFSGKAAPEVAHVAAVGLMWEAGLILAGYLAVVITVSCFFDGNGDRRRDLKQQ